MTDSIGSFVAIRSGDGDGVRGASCGPAVEGSRTGIDHWTAALQRRPHRPFPLGGRALELVDARGGGRRPRQPAPGPPPQLQAGPRPRRRTAGMRSTRASAGPTSPPTGTRQFLHRPFRAAEKSGRACQPPSSGRWRPRSSLPGRATPPPSRRSRPGEAPPTGINWVARRAAAAGPCLGGHGRRPHGPAAGVRPQRPEPRTPRRTDFWRRRRRGPPRGCPR